MTAFAEPEITPALDGRFLLVESLGQGGQGRVFRAYDRVFRRDVAIKALHGAPVGPTHPLAAEFAAWSRLRHPHVVRAYELLRASSGPLAQGTPYLVLELFRGMPVHRALSAGHEPASRLEELARRILRALDHVHGAGIVHRDLKPGNVLVAPARRGIGRVKLTDFGLASESGRAGEPGRISGSIPYVAPETVLGLQVDGRADLYGLGVLLFYLSTGRLPLASRSPERWVRWHLAGSPADPRSVRPDLSSRFVELVLALTERAREARPGTAVEALLLLGSSPTATRVPSRFPLSAAERARVRFAVDDARTGGFRLFDLPPKSDHHRFVQRELATLAAAAGLACVRLDRDGRSCASTLGRAVLTLLLERGVEARSLVESHGLHRGLPLAVLSGVPVWDRTNHDPSRLRRPGTRHVVARGVANFLLEVAHRRPLALLVDRAALHDPLAAAVVGRLRRSIARAALPRSATGGLLLAM